jgi:hypothetical protein
MAHIKVGRWAYYTILYGEFHRQHSKPRFTVLSMGNFIDKIRTYRTQTPYTFFGHKAFTAISYPGEGAKSQPTG